MQFIKKLFSLNSGKSMKLKNPQKVCVGILGTGKIGVDLLVKVMRSDWMECVIFSGRNLESEGMRYAAGLGVAVSDKGIDAFLEARFACDLVFDATTAASHLEHAQVFDRLGIFVVDMTPSSIGECCVPALGMDEIAQNRNISMISCGGQSSIPVAHALYQVFPNIYKMEIKSTVSANSIGPGTLANINEYYRNTKAGLKKYTGDINFDVDLIVDAVNLTTPMRTSIIAHCANPWGSEAFIESLNRMFNRVQAYVPGYVLEAGPFFTDNTVRVDIRVEGLGDYLPKYAGNLDIINCAAIAVAENHARTLIRFRSLKADSVPEMTYEPIKVAN